MFYNTNTAWFHQQMADKRMSQRKLAKLIDLDQAALSLTLRGKRQMRMHEAIAIARMLNVPLADVQREAGVDPTNANAALIPVVGCVNGGGMVHAVQEDGQTAPRPSNASGGTVAYRVLTEDYRDGWIVYTVPAGRVMPEAVGRLALVQVEGERSLRLCGVKHGYQLGTYRLTNFGNSESFEAKLVSASAVTWIKQ